MFSLRQVVHACLELVDVDEINSEVQFVEELALVQTLDLADVVQGHVQVLQIF